MSLSVEKELSQKEKSPQRRGHSNAILEHRALKAIQTRTELMLSHPASQMVLCACEYFHLEDEFANHGLNQHGLSSG